MTAFSVGIPFVSLRTSLFGANQLRVDPTTHKASSDRELGVEREEMNHPLLFDSGSRRDGFCRASVKEERSQTPAKASEAGVREKVMTSPEKLPGF